MVRARVCVGVCVCVCVMVRACVCVCVFRELELLMWWEWDWKDLGIIFISYSKFIGNLGWKLLNAFEKIIEKLLQPIKLPKLSYVILISINL